MSDLMPSYDIEKHKLDAALKEQHSSMCRTRLECLEIIDRINRNKTNISASKESIQLTGKEITSSLSPIESQRKKSLIASLSSNIERQTLEIMELIEQLTNCIERWKSIESSIETLISQISSIESAHGEFSPATREDVEKELEHLNVYIT